MSKPFFGGCKECMRGAHRKCGARPTAAVIEARGWQPVIDDWPSTARSYLRLAGMCTCECGWCKVCGHWRADVGRAEPWPATLGTPAFGRRPCRRCRWLGPVEREAKVFARTVREGGG